MIRDVLPHQIATERPQLTLAMHPPIVGKYNFYLYRFIELIKRFKIVLLLFKYPKV